jgi:hypothetical protein
MADIKSTEVDHYPPPADDEVPMSLHVDWTKEEEAKAKRK